MVEWREEDLAKNFSQNWREGYFGEYNYRRKWREEPSFHHNPMHSISSDIRRASIGGRLMIDGKHGAGDSRVECSA
jgi:hypothetical protein